MMNRSADNSSSACRSLILFDAYNRQPWFVPAPAQHQPGPARNPNTFSAEDSRKNLTTFRTLRAGGPVAVVGASDAATTQPPLRQGNMGDSNCGRNTTYPVLIEHPDSLLVSPQISSVPIVVPRLASEEATAALSVLQVESTAGQELISGPAPPPPTIDEEQNLAKTPKSAGRKPVLRAPTPRRGLDRFSRNGHTINGAKNGAMRGLNKADSADRNGEFDDDVPLDEPEFDELAAAEIESSAEELAGEGGSENQIDDPVRMYLMQMGEIPLLNRGRGNRFGQANRIHPPPLPPQHVGQRLFAARRRGAAGKSSRRQVAARSHDRSLGHQHRRQEENSAAVGAESENAGPLAPPQHVPISASPSAVARR